MAMHVHTHLLAYMQLPGVPAGQMAAFQLVQSSHNSSEAVQRMLVAGLLELVVAELLLGCEWWQTVVAMALQ